MNGVKPELYVGPIAGVAPVTPADIEKRAGYERGVHCEPCWSRRKRVTPANGRWGSMPYCNPCRIDDRVPHREWVLAGRADAPSAQKQTLGVPERPLDAQSPQDEPLARVTTMTAASPAARAAMGKSNPVHPLEPSESADEIRREVEADIKAKREKFVGKFDANTCGCGCGSPVYGGRVFFRGHKSRGIANPIPAATVPEVKAKQEKKTMAKLCKCGCGTPVGPKREYSWSHKPKEGKVPPAPAAPAVDPDAQVEKIAIMVSPVYLDEFWRNRSLSEKARMVSTFFEQAGA